MYLGSPSSLRRMSPFTRPRFQNGITAIVPSLSAPSKYRSRSCLPKLQVLLLPAVLGLSLCLWARLWKLYAVLASKIQRRFYGTLEAVLCSPNAHYDAVETARVAVNMILVNVHRRVVVRVIRVSAASPIYKALREGQKVY